MIRKVILGLLSMAVLAGCEEKPVFKAGVYRAFIERKDGHNIPFNFEVKDSAGRKVMYIQNAGERLRVDSISVDEDSVRIQLPFFESQLRAKLSDNGNLSGVWLIHLADSFRSAGFSAYYGDGFRFEADSSAKNSASVDGRWAAIFRASNGKDTTFRVGEFKQVGNGVTGTFLDAGGDLRYLDGGMDGDTLRLSGFDGNHCFYFTAQVSGDSLMGGKMYSGPVGFSTWTAVKDSAAHLEDQFAITKFKNDKPFGFSFKDIDGHPVSFSDDRFKGKVVLVQIMGSWCPNCMDETEFLSKFYDANRGKGVEIVSLAYERSTDFERSQKAVRSFQQRFDVKYPMLITGVTVTDPQRAAKTLPQLDDIHDFPTTIFVNKKGQIEKVHVGFSGPGTGEHYVEQKKEFYDTVNKLLGE